MKMNSNRIRTLSESPCYQCGCQKKCSTRIKKNFKLGEIRDGIFGNREFDFHDCGIWIALNAPEMVEVDDE